MAPSPDLAPQLTSTHPQVTPQAGHAPRLAHLYPLQVSHLPPEPNSVRKITPAWPTG